MGLSSHFTCKQDQYCAFSCMTARSLSITKPVKHTTGPRAFGYFPFCIPEILHTPAPSPNPPAISWLTLCGS